MRWVDREAPTGPPEIAPCDCEHSLRLLAGVVKHRDPSESNAADQLDDDGQQKCDAFRAGDRQ